MIVRFICTKENPWTPEKAEFAQHPDAEYIEDKDYGAGENVACYKCLNCGKYFEVELAQ